MRLSLWMWSFLGGMGLPVSGYASTYRSDWHGVLSYGQEINRSFLNEIRQRPDSPPEILSSAEILRLQQDYEDLTRDYVMRHNYGIVTPEQEISHTSQMSEFSKEILHRIQDYQLGRERKKLESLMMDLEKEEVVQILSLPVGVAATLWYGKTVEFSLGGETTALTKTSLLTQTVQVKIKSPLIEGGVEMVANAPAARDPASVARIDPISRSDERFRVHVVYPSLWEGMSGETVYLSTSNVLEASLKKQIFPHCQGELSLFYSLDPLTSDIKSWGESLIISYGIVL